MCDIEDMEMPLGFLVKADAFGLNVAYMTTEEQVLTNTLSNFNDTRNAEMDKSVYGSMNKLELVSFTNCRINKPTSFKFMLKNIIGEYFVFICNTIVKIKKLSVYLPYTQQACLQ